MKKHALIPRSELAAFDQLLAILYPQNLEQSGGAPCVCPC